jgi:hypothetical protein
MYPLNAYLKPGRRTLCPIGLRQVTCVHQRGRDNTHSDNLHRPRNPPRSSELQRYWESSSSHSRCGSLVGGPHCLSGFCSGPPPSGWHVELAKPRLPGRKHHRDDKIHRYNAVFVHRGEGEFAWPLASPHPVAMTCHLTATPTTLRNAKPAMKASLRKPNSFRT